jgi:polyhydroxyalkanoate synthesis regulator phasin
MAQNPQQGKKKGFMDFLSSQKWIANLEKRFEKQLKVARDSFDKNLEKARKGLNITTKKDLSAINAKIKALEKRIEKLEGAKKARPSRSKISGYKQPS